VKSQKKLMGAVLIMLMVIAAVVWWACDFEKVSPTEPYTTKVSDIVRGFSRIGTLSEVEIATIVQKLATCLTQVEAEEAIRLLLEKTGIETSATPKPPHKKSEYSVFFLSDAEIARLAAWHLSFVTGKSTVIIEHRELNVRPLTIEETFGTFEEAAKNYLHQEFELDKHALLEDILKDIQKDATKALLKPEEPGNALLLALTSEGATIPVTIPLFKKTATRSPVQHFSLALWIIIKYGKVKSGPGPKKERELCILRCLSFCSVDFFLCQFEQTKKQKEECMEAEASNFKHCLESCLHDQGQGH
jgi:hypothetical protein